MQHNQAIVVDSTQLNHWREIYELQLAQSLEKSFRYTTTNEPSNVRMHIASMLTLMEESIAYPRLKSMRMQLISALHPLPLRWGMAYIWESKMMEIINDSPDTNLQNPYLVDLAEIYLFSGRLKLALETSEKVLQSGSAQKFDAVKAIQIQFTALRSLAEPEKAENVYHKFGGKYGLLNGCENIANPDLTAWMKFHLIEVEMLREKGKTGEALALVNQMIALDESRNHSNPAFTAELHVHRSTLLWVNARYPDSISDLKIAIANYLQEGDSFTAESLKSNLGLVYWTMGDLPKAEPLLTEAILFYQKTGADQLKAYDLGNLGLVYFAQGNLKKAELQTLEHIEYSDRIGFATESYRGHSNLADIQFYYGQYERAIAEHEMVDAYFRERGSREGYGLGKVWVACSRAKLGDVDSAIKELNTVLEWCYRHQSKVLEALTHRALAQWLPVAQREPHLRQSLSSARVQGRQLEEAACLLMLAQIPEDADEQIKTWNLGVQILERIGASAWLKEASIEKPPFIAMFL